MPLQALGINASSLHSSYISTSIQLVDYETILPAIHESLSIHQLKLHFIAENSQPELCILFVPFFWMLNPRNLTLISDLLVIH